MTERTQEQLDMIYEPLQQELRDAYASYKGVCGLDNSNHGGPLSYLAWLDYNLAEINEEIANFKESE
jgi:hypothetical protein